MKMNKLVFFFFFCIIIIVIYGKKNEMQLDDVYSKALIIPSKKVLQEKSTSGNSKRSVFKMS